MKYHGLAYGIFGHTHRRKIFSSNIKINEAAFIPVKLDNKYIFSSLDQISIINAGSIGQPRSKDDVVSSWVLVKDTKNSSNIELEFKHFRFDLNKHLKSIDDSDLKEDTKLKLKSFFQQE